MAMKKIKDLRDLFIEQGRELFNAQEQELNALAKIRKIATSQELKDIIREQIKKTWKQQERIETAFKNFEIELDGELSEPFGALINKGNQLINRSKDAEIKDAEIINAIQHINHFKIAGYTALSTYANEMEDKTISRLFLSSLEEEKKIDKKLIKLAIDHISKKSQSSV